MNNLKIKHENHVRKYEIIKKNYQDINCLIKSCNLEKNFFISHMEELNQDKSAKIKINMRFIKSIKLSKIYKRYSQKVKFLNYLNQQNLPYLHMSKFIVKNITN